MVLSDDDRVDLLASVYRTAIARRSPDALLTVASVVGPVVEVDERELLIIARLGDAGRRPNPLWSRWVAHGRSLELVDPASERGRSPNEKQLPSRKQ